MEHTYILDAYLIFRNFDFPRGGHVFPLYAQPQQFREMEGFDMQITTDSALPETESIYQSLFTSLGIPVIRLRIDNGVFIPSAASGGQSSTQRIFDGMISWEPNMAALRLLEADSPETLNGKECRIVPPESEEVFLRACEELAHGGIHVEQRMLISTTHGRLFSVHATFSKFSEIDQALDIAFCFTPLRDRAAASADQPDLKDFLNHLALPAVISEPDGKILWCSKGAEELFGYKSGEMTGTYSDTLLAPEIPLEQAGSIHGESDASRNLFGEISYIVKNGCRIPVVAHKSFMYGISGVPVFKIETYSDLSGQIKANEALRESEVRFRTIFDTIRDPVFIKDQFLRYVQVNPAMERQFGIPATQILGLTDRDIFGRYPWYEDNGMDSRVLSGEVVEADQVIMVDGIPRTFHIIESPIRTLSGMISGLCGIAHNITNRKETEHELFERSHFLQILIDTIPSPVFYKNTRRVYIGCNRAFEEFLGLKREDIIGKTARDTSPPELAQTYEKIDRILLETPGVRAYEAKVRDAGGAVHTVIMNKATFLNMDGSIGGIAGIMTDITVRNEIERALIESEKRYKGLIDSQSEMVVRLDAYGFLTYANDAYCLKFGKSRKELIGKPSMHLVHEDDLASTIQATRNLEKPPYRVSIVQRALTVEGWRWIAWEDYAIKDETGRTIEIQKVGRDISSLKQMQEDLLHEIELIKLVSSISSSFINLAAEDIDEVINGSLLRIGEFTGFDRVGVYLLDGDQMKCGFSWKAGHPDVQSRDFRDAQFNEFPWWKEKLERFECIHVSRAEDFPPEAIKERKIWEELSIQSIVIVPMVHNKSLQGFLCLVSIKEDMNWREDDIALLSTVADIFVNALAHQKTELELKQSKRDLQQAERLAATGRLAASIAHEINNPLQAMTANISFLLKSLPSDFSQRYILEQLKMGIQRIKNTVRHLMDVHRSKADRIETVQVNEVIESTLNLVENQLVINKIQVGKNLDMSVPSIQGLAQELFQVFMNIVLNAVDAMPEGGTLDIFTFLNQNAVTIQFKDSGQGISTADMEHIFDPFFTTKSKMLGTGLGLSIVKGIVDSFGGKIYVESTSGEGSTFTLEFPARYEDSL